MSVKKQITVNREELAIKLKTLIDIVAFEKSRAIKELKLLKDKAEQEKKDFIKSIKL